MELYLDTAITEEIEEVAKYGILNGVTTNPSLILKNGRDFKTEIKKIIKILEESGLPGWTISLEITDFSSYENMKKQAYELSKFHKNVLIKIPISFDGLKLCAQLSKKGIKSNMTLCFNENQALLCAKANAYVVSPFIGRLDDNKRDGISFVKNMKEIYSNFGFKTKILSASIRNVGHVKQCALVGCDIATIPYKTFKEMIKDELTETGFKKFEKDWEEYKKLKEKKD
jgi:transaldolase